MITLLAQKIGGEFKPLGGYSPDTTRTTAGYASSKFASFASNVFGFLTVIAGIMFLIYFMLGAINWITAGGDSGKVEKAKSQMSNAAIGLIVVALSYSIAFIIGGVIGLDILSPGKIIETLTPNSSSTGPSTGYPPIPSYEDFNQPNKQ